MKMKQMSIRGNKIRKTYRKWWLGKKVRTSSTREFKRVVDLEFISPPSFVYGIVIFHYEDGSEESFGGHGINAFRPRKRDVEVLEE